MSIRIKIVLLLFLSLQHYLFSSTTDSTSNAKKNSTTQFFTANQFEYADSAKYIENTLYNFQSYLPRTHLGNSGLPFNDLCYQPNSSIIGFNYSKNNYANYFYSPANLKFYNTRVPYTDLFYVAGSKHEQVFKMTFSYNVKKNWNVTADFYRIHSDGFYLRQITNDNFIAVSTNYKSDNNRYNLLAGVFYNSAKNTENGGIIYDSAFANAGTGDKQLIGVHLLSAKRSVLNRNIYLKQYLNLGRKSSDTTTHNAIIPESRFILASSFEDNLLKYEDDNPQSGYYSNIYNDSAKTFDSTYNFKIENELAWKRVDNNKHRGIKDMIGGGFSVKDQIITIKQHEIDTTFGGIIAGAEFYNTYSKNKFWWNFAGKYALTGYNKNDYATSAVIKKSIADSLNLLTLSFENKQQTPDFIYHKYSSNNFRWNNNFEKIQTTRISINFLMRKYNLAVGTDINEYTNVLYFDTYAMANQYKGSIQVISAYLKKDFVFYNWHLNNNIHYQYVPDSMVIRLPQFVLEHALYYENNLFKGAMRMQIGASIFYNSAYYANTYMPATGEFYLQNNKKYGDYPFIDFFINAQIKTVRIFIKIDHLNSGLMGNNYMITPHYPMNDRAFKFGVSWRFYD